VVQDNGPNLEAWLEQVLKDKTPQERRQLLMGLLAFAGEQGLRAAEANRIRELQALRKPHSERARVLTIRVEILGLRPVIWRRLEVLSRLFLYQVATAIFIAFDWSGLHLWRFTIAGGSAPRRTLNFVSPEEAYEGDLLSDELDAGGVYIDELLAQPGDKAAMTYDYGDDWRLSLKLENVRPADEDWWARCVGGKRQGPGEDCGGPDFYKPAADEPPFSLDETNEALRLGQPTPADKMPIHPAIASAIKWVGPSAVGYELIEASAEVVRTEGVVLSGAEKALALKPYLWMLERAVEGLPLTAAGRLKPSLVGELVENMPVAEFYRRYRKSDRESAWPEAVNFRQALQRVGLLRKYKDKLLLSRKSKTLVGQPEALWDYLKEVLAPTAGEELEVTWALTLLEIAARRNAPLTAVARVLNEAGVGALDYQGQRQAVEARNVRNWCGANWDLLQNVGSQSPGAALDGCLSDAARQMALEIIQLAPARPDLRLVGPGWVPRHESAAAQF